MLGSLTTYVSSLPHQAWPPTASALRALMLRGWIMP